MKTLDLTFLSYACSEIADTDNGIGGRQIVKLSNSYAIEYNRKIPYSVYPFPKGTPNKRTALYENLKAFEANEQYRIIKELCEQTEFSSNPNASKVLELLYTRCKEYADKAVVPHIDLPEVKEDTLQLLIEDMNRNIRDNTPELVLDRLHTFSTKYIREICQNNNIIVTDDKGSNLPLHSLVGMLAKQYDAYHLFESDFVNAALKSSISIFDKFNAIRNMHSFAHDNDILNKIEAEYVVKAIANSLCFIDKIENYRKDKVKNTSMLDNAAVDTFPF